MGKYTYTQVSAAVASVLGFRAEFSGFVYENDYIALGSGGKKYYIIVTPGEQVPTRVTFSTYHNRYTVVVELFHIYETPDSVTDLMTLVWTAQEQIRRYWHLNAGEDSVLDVDVIGVGEPEIRATNNARWLVASIDVVAIEEYELVGAFRLPSGAHFLLPTGDLLLLPG